MSTPASFQRISHQSLVVLQLRLLAKIAKLFQNGLPEIGGLHVGSFRGIFGYRDIGSAKKKILHSVESSLRACPRRFRFSFFDAGLWLVAGAGWAACFLFDRCRCRCLGIGSSLIALPSLHRLGKGCLHVSMPFSCCFHLRILLFIFIRVIIYRDAQRLGHSFSFFFFFFFFFWLLLFRYLQVSLSLLLRLLGWHPSMATTTRATVVNYNSNNSNSTVCCCCLLFCG